MTRDAGADSTESNLYFTASYALVVANTKPGSPEAEKIATEYTGLARKAAQDGVKSVRRWKLEGKLPKWKAEDERMGI